jgi:hypothetical protein
MQQQLMQRWIPQRPANGVEQQQQQQQQQHLCPHPTPSPAAACRVAGCWWGLWVLP